MENYVPPFRYTEKILNLVVDIEKKLTALDFNCRLNAQPHLRRSNRVRSVYSSCRIEANSLNEQEVEDILNNRHVVGPAKEIREIKNAFRAYEELDFINPYSIEDLKLSHRLLMEGLVEDAGQFRKREEGVFSGDSCIFMAPPHTLVPELMENLFEWLNANRETINPLILSCVFHFEFIFIHPFSDGNGRTARLWHTALLNEYLRFFKYLPIESEIEKYQEEYYETILKCEHSGDSTEFIEFMLERILASINALLKEGDDDPVTRLLQVMEVGKEYSTIELMNRLNLKSRNGFRDNYLHKALTEKSIKMKYPDKPSSKNQKYIRKK